MNQGAFHDAYVWLWLSVPPSIFEEVGEKTIHGHGRGLLRHIPQYLVRDPIHPIDRASPYFSPLAEHYHNPPISALQEELFKELGELNDQSISHLDRSVLPDGYVVPYN